ncbi:MAG: spore germination protein GerW family protein, partial [Deinococcales bacterium]
MSVQDLLKTLVDEIGTLARTETVVGEALQLGEHTVIPISRVSVGFGGGSGEGEGSDPTKGGGKGT